MDGLLQDGRSVIRYFRRRLQHASLVTSGLPEYRHGPAGAVHLLHLHDVKEKKRVLEWRRNLSSLNKEMENITASRAIKVGRKLYDLGLAGPKSFFSNTTENRKDSCLKKKKLSPTSRMVG